MTDINRQIGKWKLPQPLDLKEDNEWVPVPRIARTIPFGYKEDPDSPHVLLPIKLELDLLEKARRHLIQYSYREVAMWLSKHSGRYISHVGLMKRVKRERRRKNKATSLRRWAKFVEEAIAKAEEIDNQRTGAAKKNTCGDSGEATGDCSSGDYKRQSDYGS